MNKTTDLFGVCIDTDSSSRRRHGKMAVPSPTGSGPAGMTCGDCKHAWKRHNGAKKYWKCGLVKPTRGAGTDIRLKWAACARFEKKKKHEA